MSNQASPGKGSKRKKPTEKHPAGNPTRDRFEWLALGCTIALTIFTMIAAVCAYATYLSTVDTAMKTLQAYVGIEEIRIILPGLKDPNYKPVEVTSPAKPDNFLLVKVKNYGQTPATNLIDWISPCQVPYGQMLPNDFSYPDLQLRRTTYKGRRVLSKRQLFKDQVCPIYIPIYDLLPFINAEKHKSTLFWYGHIDYSDVYGQRWTTTFCYIYKPQHSPEDCFGGYHDHNDTHRL